MFPFVPSPDSFHGLVGRLAADGGELLRRLAVEHEREVARLHAEIGRLQAEIAQLNGHPVSANSCETPDLLKHRMGTEVSSKDTPKGGREQQASARRSGVPDEKSLAKALSFVDALQERSLMNDVLPDDKDATRVLKIASEIVELTRAKEVHKDGERKGASMHGPPDENLFRGPQGGEAREFKPPGYAQESGPSPGIKLGAISPPVKAPDRMPEPPDPPLLTDNDDTCNFTLSRQLDVLDERHKLTAVYTPRSATQSGEDDLRERPSSTSNSAAGKMRHSGGGNGDAPQVPVFLKSVSKPTDDSNDLLMESLGHDALRWARETSGLPPREITTWQPQDEALEGIGMSRETSELPGELPFEPDSPESPPRETMNSKARVEASRGSQNTAGDRRGQPSDDWRSLLQVQGAKWRPSGDDGVSIAMYLESTPKKKEGQQSAVAPTSI
jgi:hypothetical protein